MTSDRCWIQTVRGGRFSLTNPRPEDVDILDIAHHLSHLCRYVGAVPQFYSVAQHSVLVSELCEFKAGREAGRWGLVHDAAEAYLGDLSWPAKQIPGLREEFAVVEGPILAAIAEWAGLKPEMPEVVKIADRRVLLAETRDLMGDPEWAPERIGGDGITAWPNGGRRVDPWSPERARRQFLLRWSELSDFDSQAAERKL